MTKKLTAAIKPTVEAKAKAKVVPKTVKENKIKLFIATPMYGGQCTGYYAQSILQMSQLLGSHGIECMFSFMFNESLITRARNALTKAFINSDATHLMFIDADIKFRPSDIMHMIAADKDVLGGIYPKKEINWDTVKRAMDDQVPSDQLKHHTGSFVVNLVNYVNSVTVPLNAPVEIYNAGTGFLLIKRNVFKRLKKHVPIYYNDVMDLGKSLKNNDPIHEYFATSIEPETQRLLSEDYHFCYIWRKIGGKVFAAPWAELSHIGTYAFEGRLTPAA